MNVIGNSLIVSTNTRSELTKIGPFNNGICILLITSSQLDPKPVAASSILGDILSKPESREPLDILFFWLQLPLRLYSTKKEA